MHTVDVVADEKPPVVRTRRASAVQRLLTIRQSSELYGVPERSLHDLIARGVLACVQFPDSRRIWLDRGDLDTCITNWKRKRA